MQLPDTTYSSMMLTIEKIIAVYELLHEHAKGHTDLTDDQLANVVVGVTDEARGVLDRARATHG